MTDAESLVRSFVEEMWGEGNLTLVDRLVHENYVSDGEQVGRKFVRRNILRFREGFPDHSARVLDVVADGDRVAALVEHAGTHLGTFGGIKPTGRAMCFLESGFFRIEEGQVIEGRFVSDGLGLRIQLGILPEDFWINPDI